MNDESRSPGDRVKDLEAALRKANDEAKRWRLKLRDRKQELQTLRVERDALAAEVKTVKTAAAVANDLIVDLNQLRAWKARNEPILGELESVRTERERLAGELDAARAKLPLPLDEANQKLREYQARERRQAHEEVWRKAAAEIAEADGKKYRLHPEAKLETLWREAGYDPEAGDPDPAQVAEVLGKVRKALPIAFLPVETTEEGAHALGLAARAATNAPVAQTKGPGPGASRGAPARESGGLTATRAQLRDPAFMANLQKQLDASPEARATFRIVDV